MATRRATDKQVARWAELPDVNGMRSRAQTIKDHTMRTLDMQLERFEVAAQENGTTIHWARTHDEARDIVLDLLKRRGVRLVAKAKSMTTEELGLREAIQEQGIECWENDLGEFIVQLSGRPPSHITAPAIHEDAKSIATLFHQHLGVAGSDDPEVLTRYARDFLRPKMLEADAGITGANFLVAETGRIVLVENEGNIRMATTLPKMHIAVVGIEKVVPNERDVPVFLSLLARSATGQKLTTYTHSIRGPRRGDEREGPEELHVVLLDGGRTDMLADADARAALHCIRCGSCLNVCPVYRTVGGHAYGSVYPGPIGAVTTPWLKPGADSRRLPYASSLCGACEEACPVKIPIPAMLLHLRHRHVADGDAARSENIAMRVWLKTVLTQKAFGRAGRIARAIGRLVARRERIDRLPPPLSGWTQHRRFPLPAKRSFQRRWAERAKHGGRER